MGWLRERKGGEGCGNGWKCFSQIVEQRADALVLSALLLRENPRLGMGRQLTASHREWQRFTWSFYTGRAWSEGVWLLYRLHTIWAGASATWRERRLRLFQQGGRSRDTYILLKFLFFPTRGILLQYAACGQGCGKRGREIWVVSVSYSVFIPCVSSSFRFLSLWIL